jgi:RHS repeat-associated protein
MLQPGRTFSAVSGYRYGFNGKEKSPEISSDDYDFGARIYDGRIGRWLSVDPLQKKYPFESPYLFSGNSPILYTDPDGREKIVATAGFNKHAGTNPMMFIQASKLILKKYVDQVKSAGNNETVSWVLFDFDYTPKQKKEFEKWAKDNGVAPPIYVRTADNLVNYLNNKEINTELIPGSSISNERSNDKVTGLTAVAHGVPSIVAFGYENTGDENTGTVAQSDFTIESANKLDKNAFDKADIQFYSCNSATAYEVYENNIYGDFPSVTELKEYNSNNPNLVSVMAEKTGCKVTGLIGTCLYRTSTNQLPTTGKTDQTVNGKRIKSISVTVDSSNNP